MQRAGRVVASLGAAVVATLALAGCPAAALATGTLGGGSSSPLARSLGRALSTRVARGTTSAAVAIDMRTGAVLYALHPGLALAPASNEKLATTYAALVRLGPAYRFLTQVLGEGERDGAVWKGDVYLKGGGDPTLHTRQLERLAAQLRSAGIRRIDGRVLADESFFDERRTAPGWKRSFYMVESPALSALVVNRAVYRKRPTPDPAGAAAALFTRLLELRGIHVTGSSAWGTAPPDAFPLAQIESQPLDEILRLMDHESDNFIAESVLKTLGAEIAGEGSTAAGARVVTETLAQAGVPLAHVRIVDGSGLSRLDRLTPRALAAILLAAWGNTELRPLVWGALPVSGKSGTLSRRLDRRPALGAVHAKTGTTAIASALSGYVRRRYAFVVLQNGHPIATSQAEAAQDRFAAVLARH